MRPQVGEFLPRQLEAEVFREAAGVALYLLVKAFGGHAIECGKIRVEDHADAPEHDDALLDELGGQRGGGE